MNELTETITDYSKIFHTQVDEENNFVSSPLGAWVLLALIAGANHNSYNFEQKAELETFLGMNIGKSNKLCSKLLKKGHAEVSLTGGSWFDNNFAQTPYIQQLIQNFKNSITSEDVIPAQSVLDEWTSNNTKNIINKFPLEVSTNTLMVLATAIATKIVWAEPYEKVEQSNEWNINTVLNRVSENNNDGGFVELNDTTIVGWVKASSVDGLDVYSVVDDGSHTPEEILNIASNIVAHLSSDVPLTVGQKLEIENVAPFGDFWSIETSPTLGFQDKIVWNITVPAWEADSSINLLPDDEDVYGFKAASKPIIDEGNKYSPDGVEVAGVQVAKAKYTAEGFEAAAVTALTMGASAAYNPRKDVTKYDVNINVNKPHAVIAVTTDYRNWKNSVWHGLPVFTAFVNKATEA